jgi:hypothetical protein
MLDDCRINPGEKAEGYLPQVVRNPGHPQGYHRLHRECHDAQTSGYVSNPLDVSHQLTFGVSHIAIVHFDFSFCDAAHLHAQMNVPLLPGANEVIEQATILLQPVEQLGRSGMSAPVRFRG